MHTLHECTEAALTAMCDFRSKAVVLASTTTVVCPPGKFPPSQTPVCRPGACSAQSRKRAMRPIPTSSAQLTGWQEGSTLPLSRTPQTGLAGTPNVHQAHEPSRSQLPPRIENHREPERKWAPQQRGSNQRKVARFGLTPFLTHMGDVESSGYRRPPPPHLVPGDSSPQSEVRGAVEPPSTTG
jgi:hypothetical protein